MTLRLTLSALILTLAAVRVPAQKPALPADNVPAATDDAVRAASEATAKNGVAPVAPAAEAAPVDAGTTDSSDTSTTNLDATGGISDALSKGLGFDFDSLYYDRFMYDPATGAVDITGKVDFKSKQLNLKCDHLVANTAEGSEKKMIATGGPVYIEQPGQVKASCGRLTYMIDKKSYVLEDNPVILQTGKDGKTTKVFGEKINIVQDENGKSKVIIEGGSRQRGGMETIQNKVADAAKPAAKKPAKKVDNNNLNAIPKLPSMGE